MTTKTIDCVVRLRTSVFNTRDGTALRKDLTVLKRKSGHNLLQEDAEVFGPRLVMSSIVNLHDVKDGIYKLNVVNVRWEDDFPDQYDYELVPYDDEND